MPNNEHTASDQKSKKSSLTLAIENNSCGFCRAAGYPTCKCGGGGGGGGSGGGGGTDGNESDKKKDATYTFSQAEVETAIQKFDETKTIFVQSQLLKDTAIDYETGLISIESDRLHGHLTLRVKPGLPKAEEEIAREFLNAVKAEFNEFKNQLTGRAVSTNNFTALLKDNELVIHIPNPKYYDEFIKHLDSKNLLPIPNPEREEAFQPAKDKQHNTFNIKNPFSTRLERK